MGTSANRKTFSPRGSALDKALWAVGLAFVGLEVAVAPGLTPAHITLCLALFLGLGLPHGALDAWIWRRASPGASYAPFFAAYFALMALVALLWWWAPATALVGFVALAVHHFGQADLAEQRNHPASTWFVLSRGALVVIVPIALHFEAARPVIAAMGLSNLKLDRSLALGVAGVVVMGHLAVLVLAARWSVRARAHEAGQALVLTAMFAVLPPLLSFTLYFALWHALGHLNELQRRWPEAAGPRRLIAAGAPFAAAATAGLVAFVEAAPGEVDPSRWAGRALVATSVLTLPHAVLISAMKAGRLGPSIRANKALLVG